MLEKSLTTESDVTIYDLEDSIAPADKIKARLGLLTFLQVCPICPSFPETPLLLFTPGE
jgi:citrate lyase beta subunit